MRNSKPAIGPTSRPIYSGNAFLSQGFRPFFLGAALWGLIALCIWLASWLGLAPAGMYYDANWHIHEMLFGFCTAAIAGFLLTAIPNWTGRFAVNGTRLLLLFLLWLAGRMSMFLQGYLPEIPIMLVDSLFLLVLTTIILIEIVAGRNWRNLKTVSIIALLAVANIWYHLESAGLIEDNGIGMRAGILLLVLIIALIGGRITPSFTSNVLRKRGSHILPSPVTNTDRFTLIVTAIFVASFTFIPDSLISAALALICAVLHLERLTRWRGLHVLFEPMLVIMHIAYLWLPVGFALLAASMFLDLNWQSAAIHAFTTGAFSSMILAVMTRASLGHTGRPLTADALTTLLYTSITLAAIFRVTASIVAGSLFHQIASAFWVLALGLFVLGYFKVLTGPDLRASRKA